MSAGTIGCLIFITWIIVMGAMAFVEDLIIEYVRKETIRKYHRARYEQRIKEIRKGAY